MGYSGTKVSYPMAQGGLMVDRAQGMIPPTNLISALNVTTRHGVIEKDYGSARLNSTPFPAGVVACWDWWPNDWTQRTIAVCRDGKIYKMLDDGSYAEVTAVANPNITNDTPTTTLTVYLQVTILQCGAESENANRKLFIFTGNNPVQVISGDGNTRYNLTKPAADWAVNNYPFYGFIHRNSVYAFGNSNQSHRIYSSKATDHEDFQDVNNFTFNVFPGDSEKLVTGWVYKSRQFVAKYPTGVYFLQDTDPDPTNWYYDKQTDAFGAASPHSACPALDDTFLATSTGAVVSVKGSFQLSNVETINLFNTLRIEEFMRQNVSQVATFDRWSIYYEDMKQVLFAYRSPTSQFNSRIFVLDLNSGSAHPFFIDKDQPNCLALRKDFQGVRRPMYGAEDGYIYRMDMANRNVAGSGYRGEFQLPYLDFGTTANKLFDFVEVTFEPSGKWMLNCDVLCDGEFIETIQFPMSYDRVLAASATSQPYNFILDQTRLSGRIPRSIRKRIHGMGRSISLKFYNTEADHNFKVGIVTVYFRPSDENQRGNR